MFSPFSFGQIGLFGLSACRSSRTVTHLPHQDCGGGVQCIMLCVNVLYVYGMRGREQN
jgi:hypothetical protein